MSDDIGDRLILAVIALTIFVALTVAWVWWLHEQLVDLQRRIDVLLSEINR